MKKSIQKLGFVAVVALMASCNGDFVNKQPLGEVVLSTVWQDAPLAEAFVTDIYNGFGQGGFNEQMLASLTDEALFTHPGRGINTFTEARSNPADIGWVNNTYAWGDMYTRIRACNLAIENLTNPQFNDPTLATRLLGEAKFMRAYYYQQLTRYYGGVPIIDRAYKLGEADYTVTRNTYEECVNFITKDLDDAATALKGKSMLPGRANEAAALALKSRVLLYAASDLHDIPTAKAKSATIAAFAKPEILGYISGSRADRWKKAKDAAKAVLNLTSYGYELNLSAPVSKDQGTTNYINVSTAKNGGEKDLILGRYFIDLKEEDGAWVGRNNGPNGYHNWAGNAPLQNLVDDYEMMDGSKFDWSDPSKATTPYQNRDPRFYGTILYDGAPWKPRPSDVAGKDPNNQIQTGQYQVTNASGAVVAAAGLDTRQSSVEDWNGSRTGYYMRKFIDPNPAIVDQNTRQQIPWPLIRYTESLLNYVEACIELGEDAEAKTYLNKVRFRAGMPAITETGSALRERYRNERRIEMAYEEQRYHDARRWMIAPATLGEQAQIIQITGTLKAGKTVSIYKYDPNNYNYKYQVTNVDVGIENRKWLDKMYFIPISRDEINRNSKLIQNPGY
ncbi:RagB/SusD family nutrient uptake outer membrane protein [Siphonobacter sp. BAB-5405]|uniref:RagB/SusD family nutrient uptake outer membrane protein n=1 Tax=Siphonobacter sp. BAB-5405 TaxID=1864825 RepID=UPI000C80014F|nr:RagB/SusD family nutrient uptake outer membrane protein [Siphonobacter sp. BAB-5405]PMD94407.1 RagB/SusD family nutrient uptake outer membrane protein [Siphonobacter sp. BAB-5405]